MTYSYEDALRLKSMEMAQECCTDDKLPKQYCTRMTLELFHRRKTMLLWFFSGRLNPASLKELAKTFECTEKALIDDWVDREKWEPFIWESQKANDDGRDLLKLLQLAREEALFLIQTCRSPNARVGAIARFIEAIKVEIELKQSLGLLPKQISPAVVIQKNTDGRSAPLMIKGVFWERPELKPMDVTAVTHLTPEEAKKDEKTT